jgi:hypothetical protein
VGIEPATFGILAGVEKIIFFLQAQPKENNLLPINEFLGPQQDICLKSFFKFSSYKSST